MDKNSVKNYCSQCLGDTNHRILFDQIQRDDYAFDSPFVTHMKVVSCNGCDKVSFREEFHDHSTMEYDEIEDEVTHSISVTNYPSALRYHKPIEEYRFLPVSIQTIYKETVDAMKAECYLLAGAGFRAVIEAICIDKEIAGRDLATKISKLSSNRLITDKEADRLHAIRFLGNDSIHEITVPKKKTLLVVLQIVEHLLNNLYLIDINAKPVLDTYISTFEEFETLLGLTLKIQKSGEEFTIMKCLGKSYRRLHENATVFENELISRINSGQYKGLVLGEIKNSVKDSNKKYQHYIKS